MVHSGGVIEVLKMWSGTYWAPENGKGGGRRMGTKLYIEKISKFKMYILLNKLELMYVFFLHIY